MPLFVILQVVFPILIHKVSIKDRHLVSTESGFIWLIRIFGLENLPYKLLSAFLELCIVFGPPALIELLGLLAEFSQSGLQFSLILRNRKFDRPQVGGRSRRSNEVVLPTNQIITLKYPHKFCASWWREGEGDMKITVEKFNI